MMNKRIPARPLIAEPLRLLQTPFLTVERVAADFGAFQKTYDVVVFGPRAGIIALQNDRMLMTRQYRLLVDGENWEIPGGRVDGDEDPAVAARRECLEETGFDCDNLVPLLAYYPGLDNVENKTSLFLSRTVTESQPFAADPKEVVEIAWMSEKDVLGLIFRGQIQDAFTIIAVLSYMQFGKR